MKAQAGDSHGHSVTIEQLIVDSLMRHMKQGLVFCRLDGTVLYWSEAAGTITGLSADSMLGQKCFVDDMESYYDDGDVVDEGTSPFFRCIEQRARVDSLVTIYRSGGRQVAAEMQFIPVGPAHCEPLGVAIILLDQTREAELHQRLLRLDTQTKTDPLTSVANRSAFEEHLGKLLQEFRSTRVPVTLAICDIDFFKRINDDYGHNVGDSALVHFAQHLKNHVRENDLVARYGGEEFVIVFAECDQESARQITDKIRRSLEKTGIPVLGGKCLTASFGVSQSLGDDTIESLFVRADQALLRAKDEGRNRVVCSELDNSKPEVAAEDDDELLDWLDLPKPVLHQEEFITPTPADVIVTKIKGFVVDQQAQITNCTDTHLALAFGGQQSIFRRGGDQSLGLLADIEMRFQDSREGGLRRRRGKQTILRISVRPRNSRDRRQQGLADAAGHLMKTICSYLMLGSDSRLKPERAATQPGEGRK